MQRVSSSSFSFDNGGHSVHVDMKLLRLAAVTIMLYAATLAVDSAALPQLQRTCLTGWLYKAGIPPEDVQGYQRSLQDARFDEEELFKLNTYALAFGFFKRHLNHASMLKKCLGRETERCQNFNPCQEGGRCDFNTSRGINVCSCGVGKKGDHCKKDCNECSGECGLEHGCHRKYGECLNSHGSYQCHCIAGYTGDGLNCTDLDECSMGLSRCHGNAICANTKGLYVCTCEVGHTGNGWNCSDCSECTGECGLDHNCHKKYGKCSNTHGSYWCSCKTGYKGNGQTCTDIDECSVGLSRCHANATCANTKGSYRCTCKVGFRGNGWQCTEICECCSSPCQHGGSCIEKVNAYSCHCSVGYEGTYCQTQWLHAHKHKSLPQVVTNLTRAVQQLTEKVVNLEKDRGRCDGSPCVGGQCVSTGRSYMCICHWNYHGKRCENSCPSHMKYSRYQGTCVCPYEMQVSSGSSCVRAPECVRYSTLSESWRNYKQHRGNQLHCDHNSFTPGWYRFTGAAGSKMPTGCAAVNDDYCGTHAPVYMREQHPVLSDGEVTRTVCGKYHGNCCNSGPWSIKVRMCPGNFYVYYLPKTLACSYTYCGRD